MLSFIKKYNDDIEMDISDDDDKMDISDDEDNKMDICNEIDVVNNHFIINFHTNFFCKTIIFK